MGGSRNDEGKSTNERQKLMDFDFSEDQLALSNLAKTIFEDLSTNDRVSEIEMTDQRFDENLWEALADSGLLGITIPENYGGLDLGMVELSLVLEQQGRKVAPVPLLAASILGSWAISKFGKANQKNHFLKEICKGKQIVTGAWNREAVDTTLNAEADGNNWRISGTKLAVPACNVSDAVLVPVIIGKNKRIAIISLEKKGLHKTIVETTSRELQGNLEFDGVELTEEDLLDEKGEIVFDEVTQRAKIGICAIVLGCCEEALSMTAQHVSEREQFGRPLSTNQGVALQAADAHIDIDGIRVTHLQAAWQLDEGMECSKAISSAKWWASEAGQRVVVTTQHLHGGTGADVSHPIHRYFLWVIHLADTLDGAGKSLSDLGKLITQEAKNENG